MKNHSAIAVISLGCPKALVDAEKIMTRLIQAGYIITSTPKKADLIIVNTCGFINDAINESFEAIETALTAHVPVIATGCLGAKAHLIREKFPTISAITGPHDDEGVMQFVHHFLPINPPSCIEPLRRCGIKLTPSHYAYLKIAEGCDHACTFCIIPQLRGKFVSRPMKTIITEAESLVQHGVKEIMLIAQDTGAYGHDLADHSNLDMLLTELSQLGVWIRLHYVYPYPFVDQLVKQMADRSILPYLDVPLQHVNPRILKWMKRPAYQENALARIQRWRSICPDLTIRSTFIVGFPSETDEEFEELINFLDEAKIDRAGCFAYSAIEGAAANQLPDPIPESIKRERVELFTAAQSHISAEKLQHKVGQTMAVLVDEINRSKIIARSMGDAPEIDGQVIIQKPTHSTARPGDLITVEIDKSDTQDLYGHITQCSISKHG